MRNDSSRFQSRILVTNNGQPTALRRSLGTADAGTGLQIATALQSLADAAHAPDRRLVELRIQEVFVASGLPVPKLVWPDATGPVMLRAWSEGYLDRKRDVEKVSVQHLTFTRGVISNFARLHKDRAMEAITSQHVQDLADKLATSKMSSGTICNRLSALSGMFERAVRMGIIASNPCASVDWPDARGVVHRMPMGDENVALLLACADADWDPDWRTVILLSRHGGLRLVDSTRLTHDSVSMEDGACLINLTPGKTQNPELLPVFGPLVPHLQSLLTGPRGPLTPSLCELTNVQLSRRFSALCDQAGIDTLTVEMPNGRRLRRRSHHSLRHDYVSGMARLGIPVHLRKLLSAHVSTAAHRRYDHSDGLDLHRNVAQYFQA